VVLHGGTTVGSRSPRQRCSDTIPLPTNADRRATLACLCSVQFRRGRDREGRGEPYNGYDILSSYAIRVTRDSDLQPNGRPEDLLTSIEESLRERRLGAAVRLQYDADLPVDILRTLLDELELSPEDLYEGEGFTAFSDLFQLYAAVEMPRLKDRPLPPHPVPAFERAPDIWSAIRAGDVLVHHPYQTFDAVTRFVREASVDPKVLAIKMTFYRVSPASLWHRVLGEPPSENGTLRQGDGSHGRSDRCRTSFVLPTL
jgi:polyphosphate kinase-like protein